MEFAYSVQTVNTKGEKEEERLLELLDAVERQSNLSQRHLASRMGVALGLANSYLRRCVRKGYVKITHAPANRYLYYLTPQGFAEKSRLTVKYLSTSFDFYRQAGLSCSAIFSDCERRGWSRVALCGASDLAEIALLRALQTEITVVGVVDESAAGEAFFGRPLWPAISDASAFDCCIVTDLRSPRETFDRLTEEIGRDRIFVPDILRI